MKKKSTEIIIQFKSIPKFLYSKEFDNLNSNLLVIGVQPREGIYLKFNTKRPGTDNFIIPVEMDFCQTCQFESNTPEAYERLLFEVMNGDNTLFTSWDEVEYSWRFVDNISSQWGSEKLSLPNYESGSFGPKESDELLLRDNRHWWNI